MPGPPCAYIPSNSGCLSEPCAASQVVLTSSPQDEPTSATGGLRTPGAFGRKPDGRNGRVVVLAKRWCEGHARPWGLLIAW